MAAKFKLVVKDGDLQYNSTTGIDDTADYEHLYDNTVDALSAFLHYIQDEDYEGGNKVTLVFTSKKRKKGSK